MALNLRPSILKGIHKALNEARTHINALDFTIEQFDGVLKITYNYNPEYFIEFNFTSQEEEYTEREEKKEFGITSTIKEVTKKKHRLEGSMAPGILATTEEFEFYGTRSIYTQINTWIVNLWEDLSANPLMREFTSHKKDLDDYLKPFKFEKITNGDQYFTPKETDDLKERLIKVEEQLADVLKQALTDKTKLKAELKELKEEFNTLKLTIPNLTRANWAKSVISKFYIWSSKKENQKLIAATAKYGQAFIEAAIN